MTERTKNICFGEGVNNMNEKKFYLPGIIVPAVAIAVNSFIGAGVINLAAAVITFIINLKKRDTHRIAIGITLAIALVLGMAIMAYSMFVFQDPSQSNKDLLMSILFGFITFS